MIHIYESYLAMGLVSRAVDAMEYGLIRTIGNQGYRERSQISFRNPFDKSS